jgi:hypothetical protein
MTTPIAAFLKMNDAHGFYAPEERHTALILMAGHRQRVNWLLISALRVPQCSRVSAHAWLLMASDDASDIGLG